MRLPLILFAVAISAPGTATGPAPAGDMPVFNPGRSTATADECPPTSRFHAAERDKARGIIRPQRLTELPMGDAYAAVYRHIGRCEAPVIVRYGIGGEQR